MNIIQIGLNPRRERKQSSQPNKNNPASHDFLKERIEPKKRQLTSVSYAAESTWQVWLFSNGAPASHLFLRWHPQTLQINGNDCGCHPSGWPQGVWTPVGLSLRTKTAGNKWKAQGCHVRKKMCLREICFSKQERKTMRLSAMGCGVRGQEHQCRAFWCSLGGMDEKKWSESCHIQWRSLMFCIQHATKWRSSLLLPQPDQWPTFLCNRVLLPFSFLVPFRVWVASIKHFLSHDLTLWRTTCFVHQDSGRGKKKSRHWDKHKGLHTCLLIC